MSRVRPIHLLLFIPYLAVLWVPWYNSAAPEIVGIPFFYWYQLLWIPLSALLLFVIHRLDPKPENRA